MCERAHARVRCAGLEVGGEHACAGAELRGEPGAEARVQAGEEEEEDHARLGSRGQGAGSREWRYMLRGAWCVVRGKRETMLAS